MSRGKQVLFTLAVALAVAVPAKAVTTSGSVAATDDRAPEPVSNLSAFNGAAGIELSWDLSSSDFVRQSPAGLDVTSSGTFVNVNDVARYNVWRSENGGDFELAGSVMAGATAFVDESVVSGSSFVYEVRAADAAGNESANNEQSAPISLGPPPTAVITHGSEVLPPVTSIDLGDVSADAVASQTFGVANAATDPAAILTATVRVEGAGFSLHVAVLSTGTTLEAIGPNGRRTFEVFFRAADVGNVNGTYTGTVTVRTNDPNNRQITIGLTARVIGGVALPEISVSPSSVAFGQRVLNSTSTKTITVTNLGGGELQGEVSISGSSAFSFEAGGYNAGDGAINFSVGFTPTAAQDYSATITITSNDEDEPTTTVPVTGAGVEEVSGPGTIIATVVKATLTFGRDIDVNNQDAVNAFKEDLIDILVRQLGISRSRIRILNVTAGSTIVEFQITNEGGAADEPTPQEAIADLAAAVADTTADEFTDLGGTESFVDQTEQVTLLPEDSNGDPIVGWFTRGGNQVGFDDFFAFADHFGLGDTSPSFDAIYDIAPEDGPDGQINFDDFFRFADDFGKLVANAAEIQDALE